MSEMLDKEDPGPTDYAKFHSQLEAQAFIREREKDPTHD